MGGGDGETEGRRDGRLCPARVSTAQQASIFTPDDRVHKSTIEISSYMPHLDR